MDQIQRWCVCCIPEVLKGHLRWAWASNRNPFYHLFLALWCSIHSVGSFVLFCLYDKPMAGQDIFLLFTFWNRKLGLVGTNPRLEFRSTLQLLFLFTLSQCLAVYFCEFWVQFSVLPVNKEVTVSSQVRWYIICLHYVATSKYESQLKKCFQFIVPLNIRWSVLSSFVLYTV